VAVVVRAEVVVVKVVMVVGGATGNCKNPIDHSHCMHKNRKYTIHNSQHLQDTRRLVHTVLVEVALVVEAVVVLEVVKEVLMVVEEK